MRELAGPTGAAERPLMVEEFWERRVETASGRVIERQERRTRWVSADEGLSVREMVEAAQPVLRALAIAMAPAVGRLAVRVLAPRLLAALPRPPATLRLATTRRRRVRRLTVRPSATLALPPASGAELPALPAGPDNTARAG